MQQLLRSAFSEVFDYHTLLSKLSTPKMFFFSASTASVNFRQTKRRVSEAFDYDT
ncbi:hypothetical protein ABID77_004528, partial [Variovorax sp. PvP013]